MIRSITSLALTALVLAGCAGSDNLEPPTELADIQPEIKVHKAWEVHAGAGNGKYYLRLHPMVSGDSIYVTSFKGELSAYNLESGKRLWEQRIENAVTAGVNGGDGVLVVGAENGDLIGLGTADGKELWRQRLSSTVTAVSAVDQGRVFARTGDGYLYGIEIEDGAIAWKLQKLVPDLSLQGQSEPIATQGVVIVGLDNGRIMLVSGKNGAIGWEKAIAVAKGRSELDRMVDIDGDLALLGTVLYAVSFNGNIAAVDARSGNIGWRREASSSTGVTANEEAVFYSDENSTVWKLDRRTGAPFWKQEDLKFRKLTRPTVIGDLIVVADFEGYLHWLDSATGKIIGRVKASSDGVLAAPLVVGDQLIVLAEDGKLSAWKPERLN
ncbi:MAG: outer membrane protein assembly factor BamB [Thiotrichales bacterium]